jgi:hypothetical protein
MEYYSLWHGIGTGEKMLVDRMICPKNAQTLERRTVMVWSSVLPSFLASLVEFVEALTIVLGNK